MHAVTLHCREADKDQLTAELYGRGTAGIVEQELPGGEWRLVAYFEAPPFAEPWLERFQPVWAAAAGGEAEWQQAFEPLAVGERLYLVPAGYDGAIPEGRLRLEVFARQASGSGYQAPTQLALEALEQVVRPGCRFLDVGTGSGILCAAARLLGADRGWGCDVDETAVREARENRTPAELWVGSARSAAARRFDVVAANLNAEALIALGPELRRVLAPGGRLVLAGFQERNRQRVAAAAAAGMTVALRLERDSWVCLVAASTL